MRPLHVSPSHGSLSDRTACASRGARRAGWLCDREGAEDVAAVVREIERKYDPAAGATAALDAVQAMTGTAGIAAVSQQDDAAPGRRLLRHSGSAADRCRHHAAAARRRRGCGLASETARRRGHPGRDTPAPDRARRQARGNAPRQGRRGAGRARGFGPGLDPGRGAGAGGAHPDRPPRAPAARRRRPGTGRDRRRPRVGPASRWIRRHLVGRDRGRAGHRRPRTADGDRHATAPGRRPARRHRDQTAAGARRPAARRRGRARTVADQGLARRRGSARLRARPGGRDLAL